MPSVRLDNRAILEVSGPEARAFLDRIVTCDVDSVAPGRAGYGALLSPQGKILADFVLFEAGQDAFLLDVPAEAAGELAKRLGLYRLRAKIAIIERGADLAVVAGWEEEQPTAAVASAPDPRVDALGWRAIVTPYDVADAAADAAPYHAHRIDLGVPEGGLDFAFGDAFPHEALMDQLGGVAFDKGCYIGQEVVSRMQHRGTARTRVVPVRYAAEAPPRGTEIKAGDRVIGQSGSTEGDRGLATLRLDRAADAIAAGAMLEADGVSLDIEPRDWIRFPLPGGQTTSAA